MKGRIFLCLLAILIINGLIYIRASRNLSSTKTDISGLVSRLLKERAQVTDHLAVEQILRVTAEVEVTPASEQSAVAGTYVPPARTLALEEQYIPKGVPRILVDRYRAFRDMLRPSIFSGLPTGEIHLWPEKLLLSPFPGTRTGRVAALVRTPYIPPERYSVPSLKAPVECKVFKSEKNLGGYDADAWIRADAVPVSIRGAYNASLKAVRDDKRIMISITWMDEMARLPGMDFEIRLAFYRPGDMERLLAGEKVLFDSWSVWPLSPGRKPVDMHQQLLVLSRQPAHAGLKAFLRITEDTGEAEFLKDPEYLSYHEYRSINDRMKHLLSEDIVWLGPGFAVTRNIFMDEGENVDSDKPGDVRARILYNGSDKIPSNYMAGTWNIVMTRTLDPGRKDDIPFQEGNSIGLIVGEFARGKDGLSAGILLKL